MIIKSLCFDFVSFIFLNNIDKYWKSINYFKDLTNISVIGKRKRYYIFIIDTEVV